MFMGIDQLNFSVNGATRNSRQPRLLLVPIERQALQETQGISIRDRESIVIHTSASN